MIVCYTSKTSTKSTHALRIAHVNIDTVLKKSAANMTTPETQTGYAIVAKRYGLDKT